MSRQTLLADQIFDGDRWLPATPVTIEAGQIVALDTVPGVPVTRVSGRLVPGFIDIQVNGGGGVLFNQTPSLAGLQTLTQAHARFGSTGVLPTVITDDLSVMQRAADAVASARAQRLPGVLGIHFEGPHLAVAKRGVHSEQFIRELSEAEWALYRRQDLGVRVLTVAPETVSPDTIAQLVAVGVHVCLGHSNADYETVQQALAAGASGFTHLYNAMSPLTSREPGMVGAALLDGNSWCGIIVDGCHAHDACLQLALRSKPRGKVVLITDAMATVGSNQTEFAFFGGTVRRDGNRLLDERGALAGSTLDMATAVRESQRRLGIDLGEALRMAARYPAEFLGLGQQRGRIALGQSADLVLLDEALQVQQCWIAGRTMI
ncbi:MAG: N-acetylglucosamine-6-phosphate deacetylase [Pseudomonadota bacterium]